MCSTRVALRCTVLLAPQKQWCMRALPPGKRQVAVECPARTMKQYIPTTADGIPPPQSHISRQCPLPGGTGVVLYRQGHSCWHCCSPVGGPHVPARVWLKGGHYTSSTLKFSVNTLWASLNSGVAKERRGSSCCLISSSWSTMSLGTVNFILDTS